MATFLLILLLISPFLLLATYLMTTKSKSFWKIFIVHTIVFVIYMTFVFNYSKLLTGHDEYGLGQIGLGILFIVGHILIGFAHGLYMKFKRQKQHQ